MNKYIVVVEEISRRTILVNAESEEQAEEIVRDEYDRENIVLDYHDLEETNYYTSDKEDSEQTLDYYRNNGLMSIVYDLDKEEWSN